MKVLWLCGARFSAEKTKGTGSWLQPLAERLNAMDGMEICNATFSSVKSVVHEDYNGISQWLMPTPKYIYDLVAPQYVCDNVKKIVEEETPDIVHIWGTEVCWASVYAQGYISTKTVIDIQGLLSSYYYYYGGLTFIDILHTLSSNELIHPRGCLWFKKYSFWKRGKKEIELLKSFKHISVQSRWVKDNIERINPHAQIHETKIILRDAFYEARPWTWHEYGNHPIIFTSSAALISYKGLHVLIRAVGILKRKYPNVELRIAGAMDFNSRDGYVAYLRKLISNAGISSNITLLGQMDAYGMAEEMRKSNVACVPSFVETYCLGFAEAMMVGVPTVASFSAALPNIANDNIEALFYNAPDYVMCASQINRILQDKSLAVNLSVAARRRRLTENDPSAVVDTQVEIYRRLINANS